MRSGARSGSPPWRSTRSKGIPISPRGACGTTGSSTLSRRAASSLWASRPPRTGRVAKHASACSGCRHEARPLSAAIRRPSAVLLARGPAPRLRHGGHPRSHLPDPDEAHGVSAHVSSQYGRGRQAEIAGEIAVANTPLPIAPPLTAMVQRGPAGNAVVLLVDLDLAKIPQALLV